MIVVADSSPLHYLILLDQAEILRRLYENVLIPDAVAAELTAASAPRHVSEWISHPPSGLQIVEVTAEDVAAVADELDLGERAAIAQREAHRSRETLSNMLRLGKLTASAAHGMQRRRTIAEG